MNSKYRNETGNQQRIKRFDVVARKASVTPTESGSPEAILQEWKHEYSPLAVVYLISTFT